MKEYRTKQINFRVTESEYARISERMQEAGVNHPSAYLRKMAMDGYILKLDLENETVNRNMNDMEEGRYKTLCEVLDLIDEQKK